MKCLADQHAIERITMVHRKPEEIAERGFFQGEAANLMFLPTITNVLVRWCRKWQFAEFVLHENFPH